MNAFDVPLTLLYTKLSFRFAFSQIIYIAHGQAGKQYINLYQDISKKKKSIIIVYDELKSKIIYHVYYLPVLYVKTKYEELNIASNMMNLPQ